MIMQTTAQQKRFVAKESEEQPTRSVEPQVAFTSTSQQLSEKEIAEKTALLVKDRLLELYQRQMDPLTKQQALLSSAEADKQVLQIYREAYTLLRNNGVDILPKNKNEMTENLPKFLRRHSIFLEISRLRVANEDKTLVTAMLFQLENPEPEQLDVSKVRSGDISFPQHQTVPIERVKEPLLFPFQAFLLSGGRNPRTPSGFSPPPYGKDPPHAFIFPTVIAQESVTRGVPYEQHEYNVKLNEAGGYVFNSVVRDRNPDPSNPKLVGVYHSELTGRKFSIGLPHLHETFSDLWMISNGYDFPGELQRMISSNFPAYALSQILSQDILLSAIQKEDVQSKLREHLPQGIEKVSLQELTLAFVRVMKENPEILQRTKRDTVALFEEVVIPLIKAEMKALK